jgi:molybdenum cofactor synthesis domain-containing protein
MTGAMMPPGADAVVKVEDTTEGGPDRVLVCASVGVGTSVRRRGEDVTAGSTVLPAGSRLDARRVALLAATGHGEVLVHRRPVVAVLSTGSELVPAGDTLLPGQIHDSNSHMLRAVVVETGAEAVRCDPVEDSGPALRAVLADLAGRVDAVVTSGGVSMGVYDVVKEAFGVVGASGSGAAEEVGTISFVQVAMQPGKPQGLGRLGPRGVPLFALPGNPVSAYVSFEVFVRPALLAMMGVTDVAPAVERGRISAPMRSPRGRLQIARAVASRGVDGLVADPVWGQASHFVADLSRANAFVVIPEDVTSLAAGDEVDIVLLSGAPRTSASAVPSTSGGGRGSHG